MGTPEDFLSNTIAAVTEAHLAGQDAGEAAAMRRTVPALIALQRQFAAAQADPKAQIPTALEIAIAGALGLLPNYGAEDKVNAYANAMTRRDLDTPVPHHEHTTTGEVLKAGK